MDEVPNWIHRRVLEALLLLLLLPLLVLVGRDVATLLLLVNKMYGPQIKDRKAQQTFNKPAAKNDEQSVLDSCTSMSAIMMMMEVPMDENNTMNHCFIIDVCCPPLDLPLWLDEKKESTIR